MYKKSVIVERADYDKDGHMVYAKFGNGTETTYAYDSFKAKKDGKGFLFTALALLLQPFFKITLGRTIWNIVDVIVAITLFYFIVKGFKKK